MVWGAFVVCLVLGGIFVVAMPTFSHDPRFEASVVGDLRTVVMAEAAYASVTGGVYGPLECLATPASCLKGYTGPVFLESRDHRVLESVRYRYRRTFHAGPERTGDNGTRGPASYAYVAVPLKRRSYSARSFCVDDTGILRHDKTGAPPPIKDGRCPETMPPLD